MKLTVTQRDETTKARPNQLRREGQIPAVLYGAKKPNENILVPQADYEAIIRKLKPGQLLTIIFALEMGNEKFSAILKNIQYCPITYKVIHLDFLRLAHDVNVELKVPIRFIKEIDCKGVKQGGVLKQPIRALKVRCLPKDIPEQLFLDVSDIALYETKKLLKIEIPRDVRPLDDLNEVVALVAKR